jgi:hypothetical protein
VRIASAYRYVFEPLTATAVPINSAGLLIDWWPHAPLNKVYELVLHVAIGDVADAAT